MKIIHFSTFDLSGGAGIAAYRIHHSLRLAGLDSKMIVAEKTTGDDTVTSSSGKGLGSRIRIALSDLDRYYIARKFFNTKTPFYTEFIGLPGDQWKSHLNSTQVIHLHWISGFLTSRYINKIALFTQAPIVWTLTDLAPLTGGCHYTGGCEAYTQRCGKCPQIHSTREWDLSRWTWQSKARNFKNLSITIVAPTQWVADRAKASSLFGRNPIIRIPLTVNPDIFRPLDQSLARQVLRLPHDKRLILCGASSISDHRKGFPYLIEALKQLRSRLQSDPALSERQIALVVAGQGDSSITSDFPFESHHLGWLNDERVLALAYQAADVFVCSSIEDAGPMMINESLMCGTPVVAFNTGGAPDWIENMRTGYLAAFKDSSDLADGIYMILKALDRSSGIRIACRELAVKRFAPDVVTKSYAGLYRSLTEGRKALA